MKILQINAVYGISSTGRTTKELQEVLCEQGHEAVSAVAKTNTEDANIIILGNALGRKLHAFFSRVTGKQGYFSFYATRKLLKIIDKDRPDVVHLRNLHTNYIHLPRLLKELARKDLATVITLHDCWFFTGKCTHYVQEKCYKWQTGCFDCPKLKADNESWFFDKTSAMWREKKDLLTAIPRLAVVGVSEWITNQARSSFLKNAKIVTHIYNWIDTQTFQPREETDLRRALGLENKAMVLGISQYWSENKGLGIFLKMASKMQNVVFVMIGTMPSDLELPNNILPVGEIKSTDKLAQYYNMADVLLNPSLYETFGKTTAEALACGTPVIGFNSTATPELIGQGCGVLVEVDDDINEIENAIKTVLGKGKAAYSSKCREYAVRHFSKDDQIKKQIELYREIIDA